MTAGVQTEPREKTEGAWYNAVICLGGVLALLALFLVPPALLWVEHWAADWRTAWLSERLASAHPKIAIISITEKSVEPFPYVLPINRGYLADVVSAVDKAGARAIGLDFYFTRSTEQRYDDKLRETLGRVKDKLVLGVYERVGPAQREYQYELIGDTRAGYIDLAADADHVVRYRSAPPDGARYQESFSSVLGKAGGWSGSAPPKRIGWLLPPGDRARTFLTVEAHRLLKASPEENAELLKDRIVLIGGALYTLDRHWTPLSIRSARPMIGVEIHAHMIAELIDDSRSYSELGPRGTTAFLFALAALGAILSLRFSKRQFDYLDWRVVSFGVIAVDLLLFKFLHVVLPFTLAAVAWVAAVTTGRHLRPALAWLQGRWNSA
jgi:CHASE2 domain-containing sensor protein